jgi:hypothetical protein
LPASKASALERVRSGFSLFDLYIHFIKWEGQKRNYVLCEIVNGHGGFGDLEGWRGVDMVILGCFCEK